MSEGYYLGKLEERDERWRHHPDYGDCTCCAPKPRMKRSEASWWLFAAGVALRDGRGSVLAAAMLMEGPMLVHRMARATADLSAAGTREPRLPDSERKLDILGRRLCRLVWAHERAQGEDHA